MQTITITVDKDGNLIIDAAGFKNKNCLAHLKAIGDALGVTLDEQHKPEANVQEHPITTNSRKA